MGLRTWLQDLAALGWGKPPYPRAERTLGASENRGLYSSCIPLLLAHMHSGSQPGQVIRDLMRSGGGVGGGYSQRCGGSQTKPGPQAGPRPTGAIPPHAVRSSIGRGRPLSSDVAHPLPLARLTVGALLSSLPRRVLALPSAGCGPPQSLTLILGHGLPSDATPHRHSARLAVYDFVAMLVASLCICSARLRIASPQAATRNPLLTGVRYCIVVTSSRAAPQTKWLRAVAGPG